jgi:2-keto-4-pentenoate hydratase
VPGSLEAAYVLQQAVQIAWGQARGGVKVGRVLGEWAERFGVDRFTGPVDAATIRRVARGEKPFRGDPGGHGAAGMRDCGGAGG